jgi:hypothetical protein
MTAPMLPSSRRTVEALTERSLIATEKTEVFP